MRLNTPASALMETGNLTKIFKVQGEVNPQSRGVDTSKLCPENLQNMINVCEKF